LNGDRSSLSSENAGRANDGFTAFWSTAGLPTLNIGAGHLHTPAPVTSDDAHRAWLAAEKIRRVADRLVGLGPFGIGLDGLLAPVPLAGTLFSLAAGVWLIREALRARASGFTLARMAAYVGIRTLASVVPLEGWLVDVLFRGHAMAARALQKDIARRFGEPPMHAILDARRRPFRARSPLGEPLTA
jgi:hypothetical protein